MPSRSRHTVSAAGSVALLELVENAVTSTSLICRKNSAWTASGEIAQPERHRAEQVQQQHRCAAHDEKPERDQDVEADLDDHAENHRRYGIGREPQREMHDAGHEVARRYRVRPAACACVRLGSDRPGGADQDREHDQRQHVAEHVALVADERAEQVARHEHVDDAAWGHPHVRLARLDVRAGLAAVLLHQAGRRRLLQSPARIEQVHHDQAERGRNRHVDEEQRERAAGQRPEVRRARRVARRRPRGTRTPAGSRRRTACAGTPVRVGRTGSSRPSEPARASRHEFGQEQHECPGDGAERQAQQDAVGKPGIGVGRHESAPHNAQRSAHCVGRRRDWQARRRLVQASWDQILGGSVSRPKLRCMPSALQNASIAASGESL